MAVQFGIARAVGRAFIPALVKRGLGSNAIQRYLRAGGFGYRRIDMLKDVREITGLMRMEKYVKAVSGSAKFPKFGMVEHGLGKDRRYRVFADMQVEDMATGETKSKTVSFYDDELRSKDKWAEAFEDQYAEGQYETGEIITSVDIRSVEHQPGWAY